MASIDMIDPTGFARQRRSDEREQRVLRWVLLPLFLTAALAMRFLPRGWRSDRSVFDGRGSIFAEARAAASCISFAFR